MHAHAMAVTPSCSEKSAYPYPIILKGPFQLWGTRVTNIQAFRYFEKQWYSVPTQVEEVNANGDYVLEGGLPFTKDTDDKIFDHNDEVVFEGGQLGEDFKFQDITPDLSKKIEKAWKLTYCHTSRRFGTVLLATVTQPTDVKFRPAVKLDLKGQVVDSSQYKYIFNKQSPVLLGQVFVKNGKEEFGVLEDSSFRMEFLLPWWLPNIALTDDDFTSTIESWQAGPVRTIIAIGVKFRKFLSVFNFHLFSELVFYRNMFQIPTIIEFPFNASEYFRPGSGLVYSLRFPEGREWKLETNLVELPKLSAEEVNRGIKASSIKERFYANGERPEAEFRINVRVDDKAKELVPPPFIVHKGMFQNDDWAEFWPWLKETNGDLGVFLDISGVRKGSYNFGLDLVLGSKADLSTIDYGLAHAEWASVMMPISTPPGSNPSTF